MQFGAKLQQNMTTFTVWAPKADTVDVELWSAVGGKHSIPMIRDADIYTLNIENIHAGQQYQYRVNTDSSFPDPASSYQPNGVHGPSQVVNHSEYSWTDSSWQCPPLRELTIYELHIGTFTPEGTFAAAKTKLPWLKSMGITAIELLPVADFPGEHNWGYDGVMLFAPARCYGTPAELQDLVNQAHELGIAVFMDVVYNHFGPDGNYTSVYSDDYVSKTHVNPWGASFNFDGPGSQHVREFFIQNAIHWLKDYHIDGLRLDATHAIIDDSAEHFLAELNRRVREELPARRVLIMAEDHRNWNIMTKASREGGWGLDAVWADDFHHDVRRFLAGDHEGYYADFTGKTDAIATTLNQGWLYSGQFSQHSQHERGTDPTGLAPESFIICIQNHDQIGNRAFGERLNHQIEPAAYRAASALLLLAPQTPMLFMGQEWAATSPFQFFTDHNADLGKLVTQGRRQEFGAFSAFNDPAIRNKIPDPQAIDTFLASKLNWSEIENSPHHGILALYQALLLFRQECPIWKANSQAHFHAEAIDAATLLCHYKLDQGIEYLMLIHLRGSGTFTGADHALTGDGRTWKCIMHTDQPEFLASGEAPELHYSAKPMMVTWTRPGALILQRD